MRNLRFFETKEEAENYCKGKRNCIISKLTKKERDVFDSKYYYSVRWTFD